MRLKGADRMASSARLNQTDLAIHFLTKQFSTAFVDFFLLISFYLFIRGGRVVRRCWVNFQCRGVLLSWIAVGQGPIVLAVGAGGGCLDIFSLIYHFSFLSPFLWETARYRLKYCLKGLLSPKQQTTNKQHIYLFSFLLISSYLINICLCLAVVAYIQRGYGDCASLIEATLRKLFLMNGL